ncbi:MAG: type I-A CRISPR-associated protein Csa5 [Candidatus Korarchaeum sp.]
MSVLARLLAVLVAENWSYTYVDKLAYAPSKDLALYYLREALRDFHSLMNKADWDNPRARDEASKIDMSAVERELQEIEGVRSMRELREKVSLLAAKALSLSSWLMSEVRS